MEKLSYNSYPDSTESSPRSRDIDFDNPPPWDDHNHHKVRFMCSYGGKIQPRPHDNQLTYINGETKILSVDRGIRFPVLASKLSAVCGDGSGGGGGDVLFKYQLPGEDLDALISVTNDDDLEHMMHEYDRLLRVSSKPARMRLFLFPVNSGRFGSEGSVHSDRDRFVEALNRPDPEKAVTPPDFLFEPEKVAVAPPPLDEVKIPVPVAMEPPDAAEMQRQMYEFQRMQIRDQEAGLMVTGGYLSPPYAGAAPPPYAGAVPPPRQQTITHTNTQAPPRTYWQGNQYNPPGGVYPTTGPGLPDQPVYMVPSPTPTPTPHQGTVYHAPVPQQSVMRPGQGNQGGYYPQIQRIPEDTYREQQHQHVYNMAQPQVGAKAQQQQPPPQNQYSAVPPPRQVVGIPDTTAYSQVNYAGGMGKQVYYNEAPPPQYHGGVGLPVNGMNELRTGPDGRPVVMNIAPKVSSQSSDSAV